MSDASKPIPPEVWEAMRRHMMWEEALASVALDTEGDVHTCYDGCPRCPSSNDGAGTSSLHERQRS